MSEEIMSVEEALAVRSAWQRAMAATTQDTKSNPVDGHTETGTTQGL